MISALMCHAPLMAPGTETHDHPGEYDTINELWAGVDPAKDPLDTKVIEEWIAQGIAYTRLTRAALSTCGRQKSKFLLSIIRIWKSSETTTQ